MINPLSDGNEHLREPEEHIERHTIRPAEEVVTATRFIEAEGKKWKIERKDPHGFWNIISPGRVVNPFKDRKYTTAKLCEHAIEHYTNVTAPAEAKAAKEASAQ